MNVPLVLFLSQMQQQQKSVVSTLQSSFTHLRCVMLSNNEEGLYIILIIEETHPCSSHSPAPLKHCPNSVLIPRLTLRDNTRLSHTFIVSHPKSIFKKWRMKKMDKGQELWKASLTPPATGIHSTGRWSDPAGPPAAPSYPINPFMVAGLPHPSFDAPWGTARAADPSSPIVPPFPGKYERNEDMFEDYLMRHHRLELARRQRAFKNVSDYISHLAGFFTTANFFTSRRRGLFLLIPFAKWVLGAHLKNLDGGSTCSQKFV